LNLFTGAVAHARAAIHFFVAAFAFEFKTDARGPACLSQDPMPRAERRIMTHVLKMSTFERGPPMAFVVLFKPCDSLSQNRL
jgi:hypothetical protein